MVIWLIGLSASGKTTIGGRLKARLDSPASRWILVDGDAFREAIGGDTGHSLEERRKNGYRISRFCRFLELQDVNVIACVLSMFHDNQEHNRSLFSEYREVYIRTSREKLESRDNKQIYAAARSGRLKDVAGVDLPFPEPLRPDFILENEDDTADFDSLALRIADNLGLESRREYAYPRPGHLPEKYQYTPFEGPGFLLSYRRSRVAALEALGARVARLTRAFAGYSASHFLRDKYALPPEAGFFLSAELPMDEKAASPGRLATRTFLLDALRTGGAKHRESLIRLLGRFEATKKVHSAYAIPAWRKEPEAEEDVLGRILLSLALLDWISAESDKSKIHIAFNAVLKLNDLLVAAIPSSVTPSESFLVQIALKAELDALATLEGLDG